MCYEQCLSENNTFSKVSMNVRLNPEELRDMYRSGYVLKHKNPPVKRIHNILKHIKLNRTDVVADYACGDGILMESVYNRAGRYVGIDFSDELLRCARDRQQRIKASNVEFICQDIVTFCEENQGRFDKAFALDFSEHIYDDIFVSIFSAVRSSLKADGKLYLHTPNAGYFIEILKKIRILDQFPEHIAVRSGSELVDLLKLAGFTNASVSYLPHYNILKILHFLSIMPVLGKYFQARLLIECSAA
jgi:2-polyprenyl-3-methyl-5-hydroxy-6-metoxy-1,4-benzoquinol methylase